MIFIAENQLYKKITVQLSVKGKEGAKKLLLGMKGLEQTGISRERFN